MADREPLQAICVMEQDRVAQVEIAYRLYLDCEVESGLDILRQLTARSHTVLLIGAGHAGEPLIDCAVR
jgi:hypothetical protein